MLLRFVWSIIEALIFDEYKKNAFALLLNLSFTDKAIKELLTVLGFHLTAIRGIFRDAKALI